MIRLLGAITGSALALATLLVLIGIPQFKAESNDINRTVVTLPLATSPVENPQADVVDETEAVVEELISLAEEVIEDGALDDSAASATPATTVALASDFAAEPVAVPDEQTSVDQAAIDDAQSWYAFWSPFRSEFAASGFVDQLQRVTGLDYRVVKVKPGVYEVAFAYIDDNDILDNLSQITAATGLEMPEG